ncbi:flagellar hook-length control protein FliK, partial [Dyella sp.]|uniref:flagellar hook-length control protein FliK n=1 Tax=Dyella sp. TaxID=1869338 RepID=UPI002ED1167A
IALNTLDNMGANPALPVQQAPLQQTTTTPQDAQAALSLPQQALAIAAQVAAVQTQVANRQATQSAPQAASSSNAAPVLGAAPAAAQTATTLPAAAPTLQDAASPLAEPAVASTAAALSQPATQPAAATQTQAQPQNVRLAAASNSVNPVASATKQAANAAHAGPAKTGDDAATAATQPAQVPLAVAAPVAPTVPQHAAAAAVQANINLASLSSTSPTSGSQSGAGTTPSQVPAVLNLTATPVGSAQWNTDLGRQMVLLSNNAQTGNQTAELRLDPPNLGPLHVTINLSDGVASAAFVSAHAVVRQALESAMPQLQTAFEQAGLSLGQTSVGDQNTQSFEQRASGGQSGRSASVQTVDGSNTVAAVLQVSTVRDSNALVDTFA